MSKLKLAMIMDDKPTKLTVELPAAVYRDLVAYAKILAKESDQEINDPAKLVAPMIARFMTTDRAFAKKRQIDQALTGKG